MRSREKEKELKKALIVYYCRQGGRRRGLEEEEVVATTSMPLPLFMMQCIQIEERGFGK